MDFSVCVLSSGSTGNAILVTCGSTRLLIDAGLSGKKIVALLNSIEVNEDTIDAIFVTHGHHDHIMGVGILARKLGLPVYATTETFRASRQKLKKMPICHDIHQGRVTRIGELNVLPFPTFHDSPGAVAFVIKNENKSLGILTDIGHVTRLAFQRLRGCSTLVLESNYCPVMLREGPYPWSLKQRIKGRQGHLSNQDTGRVIEELSKYGLKKVLLSHLSEENNHPDVVMRTLVDQLPPHIMEQTDFFYTYPDKPSKVVLV